MFTRQRGRLVLLRHSTSLRNFITVEIFKALAKAKSYRLSRTASVLTSQCHRMRRKTPARSNAFNVGSTTENSAPRSGLTQLQKRIFCRAQGDFRRVKTPRATAVNYEPKQTKRKRKVRIAICAFLISAKLKISISCDPVWAMCQQIIRARECLFSVVTRKYFFALNQ